MNYYPFHIGDYAFHTRHLTLMEDLAYRRVLDLYYSRDGVLPEGVARLIGMGDHAAEVATILAEFFPGGTNKRADEEIAKMHAKQENARASVAKRGGVTQASRKHDASVDLASTTNNQEPITKNQEKEKAPAVPRARRCPSGWAVPQDVFESMAAECPGLDLGLESAKFRDWEFKTARSDWAAAWRTWMRKASENLAQRPTGETSYARSMREKYEQVTPLIAAKAPGPRPNPMDVIEGMIRDPLRIAR